MWFNERRKRDTHLMHWMALVRWGHDPENRMVRRHVNGMVDHRSQIRIFLHGQSMGTPPRLGRPVTNSLENRAFFVHRRKKGHDPCSLTVSFAVLSTVCFGTKPKSVANCRNNKEAKRKKNRKHEMRKEITIERNETNIPNQSKQIANGVINATDSISITQRYDKRTTPPKNHFQFATMSNFQHAIFECCFIAVGK